MINFVDKKQVPILSVEIENVFQSSNSFSFRYYIFLENCSINLFNSNTHLKIQLNCDFIEMLLCVIGCIEF